MEELLSKWAEYDTDGTGYISPENLAFFLFDINHPLGFKEDISALNYDIDKKRKSRNYIVNFNKKIVI